MRPITRIIIHHTATEYEAGNNHEAMYSIWRAHVIGNSWTDIGYHYISFGGLIRAARPIWDIGAHCKGYNSDSIGFSIAGDYSNYTGDCTEFYAEVSFVADLCRQFNLSSKDVYGHNEYAETICPGFDMTKFRELVQNDIDEWRRVCHR